MLVTERKLEIHALLMIMKVRCSKIVFAYMKVGLNLF